MKQININPGFFVRFLFVLLLTASFNIFSPPSAKAQSLSDFFEISYSITGLSQTQVHVEENFTITFSGQATAKKNLGPPFSLVNEASITGRIVARPASGPDIILNSSYTVTINPFPKTQGVTFPLNTSVNLKFPTGSTPGDYQIIGKLIAINAAGINVLEFYPNLVPPSQTAGSVVLVAPIVPSVPSGGGGGGVVTIQPVTPAPILNITILGKTLEGPLNADGSLKQEVKIRSQDGGVSLFFKEGTVILNKDGNKLETISVNEEKSLPPPSEGYKLIANAYNLGPAGARFQPYLELSISYDDKLLPKDVAEKDLLVAYWDEISKKWIPVESQVDSQAKAVIARVNHLTLFSIMGKVVLPPPLFTVSNFLLSPTEVKPGESITISAEVSNKGGSEGKFTLNLTMDGLAVESREISLPAGSTQKLSFNIATDKIGAHTLSLGSQTAAFSVIAPSFLTIENLTISPTEVKPGESVSISAEVSNKGGSEGKFTLSLTMDGLAVESREISLPAGSTQKLSFNIATDKIGAHTFSLGSQTAAFSVIAPPSLTIENLTLSPTEVKPGESISISAEVSNKGGSEGKFTLSLTLDGLEAENREISLPAGASQKLSFNITTDKIGSHTLSLGSQTAAFSVIPPRPVDLWYFLWYIIIAGVSAIGAIYMLLRIYSGRIARRKNLSHH